VSKGGGIDVEEEYQSDELFGDNNDDDVYVNEWAMHISGGNDMATGVARDFGYENLGQVGTVTVVFSKY